MAGCQNGHNTHRAGHLKKKQVESKIKNKRVSFCNIWTAELHHAFGRPPTVLDSEPLYTLRESERTWTRRVAYLFADDKLRVGLVRIVSASEVRLRCTRAGAMVRLGHVIRYLFLRTGRHIFRCRSR